jgi:hypothetical protein
VDENPFKLPNESSFPINWIGLGVGLGATVTVCVCLAVEKHLEWSLPLNVILPILVAFLGFGVFAWVISNIIAENRSNFGP